MGSYLFPIQTPFVSPQRDVLFPIYLEASPEDGAGAPRRGFLAVVVDDGLDFLRTKLSSTNSRFFVSGSFFPIFTPRLKFMDKSS